MIEPPPRRTAACGTACLMHRMVPRILIAIVASTRVMSSDLSGDPGVIHQYIQAVEPRLGRPNSARTEAFVGHIGGSRMVPIVAAGMFQHRRVAAGHADHGGSFTHRKAAIAAPIPGIPRQSRPPLCRRERHGHRSGRHRVFAQELAAVRSVARCSADSGRIGGRACPPCRPMSSKDVDAGRECAQPEEFVEHRRRHLALQPSRGCQVARLAGTEELRARG